MLPKSTPTGRFQSQCRNPKHSEWLAEYPDSTELCGSPDVLVKTGVTILKEFNAKKRGRGNPKFCEFCINEVNNRSNQTEEKESDHAYFNVKKRKIDFDVPLGPKETLEELSDVQVNKDDFMDLVNGDVLDTLDGNELASVASKVGVLVGQKLKSDSDISKLYHDPDYLQNLDLERYTKRYNPALFGFLLGLSGGNTGRKQSATYMMAKCLEMIYSMVFANVILPICFLQNLLMYSHTNSKFASNLLGKGGPYGSYQAVREWIKGQTTEPLSFPSGDCVVIFDNNQVIGRSWTIKVNHKTRSSVVTTICQIEYDGYEHIQRMPQFKPFNWIQDLDILTDNVKKTPRHLLDMHYKLLYFSIAERLSVVMDENKAIEGCVQDEVDKNVSKLHFDDENKTCANCGSVNPKSKRVCVTCKVNLKQAELQATQADVYGTFTQQDAPKRVNVHHEEIRLTVSRNDEDTYTISREEKVSNNSKLGLENQHRETPPRLTISDPAFVNPNSLESCKLILRQIGLVSGIKQYGKGDREWLFVVCDGMPFGLCKKIIETTFRCKLCQSTGSIQSFSSDKQFEDHHNNTHADKQPQKFREFDWVILRPGNGHFEMNMFKSFIELNWEVFFSELAKLMGFKSENAQRAAKHATDNHKTWSLLQIAYEALLDELLVPYVRLCRDQDLNPTPQGFLKFAMTDASNPNYVYIAMMVLTYLQSIVNFRAGLRCGDIETIVAAKAVFAPLFHVRNHPKYRDIEMTEAIQRQCIPDELRQFYNETESVSLTGKHANGEGLDFKAEVVNKQVQSWMPRGVPTGEDWLRVTRNLESFQKLGEKFHDISKITDQHSSSTPRSHDLGDQIFAFRTLLRQKQYLTNPCAQNAEHVSLNGSALSGDLINFNRIAVSCRNAYFDNLFGCDNNASSVYVCVTKDEEDAKSSIVNMNKSEIYDAIDKMIPSVSDPDLRDGLIHELTDMHQKLTRTKRSCFIEFHNQVKDILLDQELFQQTDGELQSD